MITCKKTKSGNKVKKDKTTLNNDDNIINIEYDIDNPPIFPEPKRTDSPETLRRIIREQSKWNLYIENVIELLKMALIRAELVTGYSVDVTNFDSITKLSSLQVRFQAFIEASLDNFKIIHKYGGWEMMEPILNDKLSDRIRQIFPGKSNDECIETIKRILCFCEDIRKIFQHDKDNSTPSYFREDTELSHKVLRFFESGDDSLIIDLIKNARDQIPKLSKQIYDIKNDLNISCNKYDNLQNEYNNIENINQNLKSQINKLNNQLGNIKNEKIKIQNSLNDSRNELNHLRNCLKNLEKENKEMQCRAKQNEEDKDVLRKSLEQHVKDIEELTNEIARLKSSKPNESVLKEDIKEAQSTSHHNIIINQEAINKMKRIKSIDQTTTFDVFEVIQEKHFALKIFHNDLFNDYNTENIKKILNEYEVLNQLDHPNIIKTFGINFGDSKHSPAILFEFYTSNLKKKVRKLTNNERIKAIIDICLAMKEVHSAGIIHRNLRLENILLDENNKIKLSDFGLSTLIELESDSMSRSQILGTFEYMAPELLQEKTDYNEKVDVYAFGVVVFLILTKGEFPRISPNEVLKGKKANIPKVITKFSRELIGKCWSFKAEERPSFEEIYKSLSRNENNLI